MVNQRMLGLGTARSVIRELFEYGKIRAAQVGRRMSSISPWATPASPAPRRSTTPPSASFGEQPEVIHCYTSAQG